MSRFIVKSINLESQKQGRENSALYKSNQSSPFGTDPSKSFADRDVIEIKDSLVSKRLTSRACIGWCYVPPFTSPQS